MKYITHLSVYMAKEHWLYRHQFPPFVVVHRMKCTRLNQTSSCNGTLVMAFQN